MSTTRVPTNLIVSAPPIVSTTEARSARPRVQDAHRTDRVLALTGRGRRSDRADSRRLIAVVEAARTAGWSGDGVRQPGLRGVAFGTTVETAPSRTVSARAD